MPRDVQKARIPTGNHFVPKLSIDDLRVSPCLLEVPIGDDEVPTFVWESVEDSAAPSDDQDAADRKSTNDLLWFHKRLQDEISRARRGLGPFSLIFVELVDVGHHRISPEELQKANELLVRSLRPYDTCCLGYATEFRILLPGATYDDCAAIVARLRATLVAGSKLGQLVNAGFGTATWPTNGKSADALLDQARGGMRADQQRLCQGEVEFDGGIPSSMVEDIRSRQPHTTKVKFKDFPKPIQVKALPTPKGLQLKLPLSFLRTGAVLELTLDEGQRYTGMLEATFMRRPRATEGTPVMYLDVTTDQEKKPS